jgi:hypothetical protein
MGDMFQGCTSKDRITTKLTFVKAVMSDSQLQDGPPGSHLLVNQQIHGEQLPD